MLDGNHVRRRSINSMIGASPCVRVEKMKHSAVQLPQAILQFKQEDFNRDDSPKNRLLQQPSIASTSSHQFGDERMIMARKGLLERQSLEDSALIAHGEDLLASRKCLLSPSRGPANNRLFSEITVHLLSARACFALAFEYCDLKLGSGDSAIVQLRRLVDVRRFTIQHRHRTPQFSARQQYLA